MKSAFSYDSPVMQILMYIGDLIILNFIFLVCCIPVFTIGAAQAGLYTAMKVLNDKEDDSSPTAAFFRGFKNGFLKVTAAWLILAVTFCVLTYVVMLAYAYGAPGWLCLLPLVIVGTFMAAVPAFHSRFGCTAMQLIRNCWFLIFAHPIRSIVAAALIWLPVVLFVTVPYYLIMFTPIWVTLYFSTAILFGELFFRKPFKVLVEEFNRRQAEATANDPDALPEGQAETEEEEETESTFSDIVQ